MSEFSHISNTVLNLSDKDKERLFNLTKAILKQYSKFENVFLNAPVLFKPHSFKRSIDRKTEEIFEIIGIEGTRKHINIYLKGSTVEIQFVLNNDQEKLHSISLRIEPQPKGRFILLLETLTDKHWTVNRRCSWYFPSFVVNARESSDEVEQIRL